MSFFDALAGLAKDVEGTPLDAHCLAQLAARGLRLADDGEAADIVRVRKLDGTILQVRATRAARENPMPAPAPLAPRPLLVVAHNYVPNETATYGGGDHLVLTAYLARGRLVREAGQQLCTSKRKWDLRSTDENRKPSCKRCIAVARHHGLPIPNMPETT